MSHGFYEEESTGSASLDTRLVRRLWSFLRPYWHWLLLAIVLVLGMAVLELIPQLVIRHAIDHQLAEGSTDGLGLLVALFVGSLAGVFVLGYAQYMLMAYVGQRAMMDLRMQLFEHLQRMSVRFFDHNPVGRLVTRLTNDIAVIESTLSQGVVMIFTNLLMVSGIVVVLVVLDWRLALLMYAFVIPLVFTVRLFARAQREAFRDQRVWLARINAFLNEMISGIAVIQLFNRQRLNRERFDERNTGALNANLRVLFWYAVFEPTVVLFGAVTTAAILWYGGGRAIEGAVSLGTVVAFIGYMQRFFWPIRQLSEQYTTLQSAMAAGERVFALLDEPEDITDPAEPVVLEEVRGKIEFRDVWFAYEPGNWVLKGVSFTLEPGTKLAVVGATGAGKSTMMALLSRFYDVQQGTILVDDVPITALGQRALRRHVGVILQEPYIRADTILENIRLRDHSISRDRVHEAARAVGADHFIEAQSNGYDTELAERGANLSTGQKQLIALARVAAFDPEIVLVMDEATASVDPETERAIQRGIERVMSGRTSIVIAHRLNTIRAVDRILVLHRGEVREDGGHAELLALGGYYSHLYELQYEGAGAAGG